jgi:hypothetical protein
MRRRTLRPIALLTALIALFAASPAAAAWQTYSNQNLGYSVSFPGASSESAGTYKSDLIPGVPTHQARFQEGDSTLLVLTVDTGRREDGAIIMGEFEYWLSHFGDVVVNTTLRLNVGMEYGRFLTLDCRAGVPSDGPLQVERANRLFQEAANLSCPTGARLSAALFFTQGRLYAIIGMQTGADAKLSNAPVRFINSLQWIAGNAEYGRALIARSSLADRAAAAAAAAAAPAAAPAP